MLSLGLDLSSISIRRIGAAAPPAFDPANWAGCTLDLVAEDAALTAFSAVWTSRVGSASFSSSGGSIPSVGTPLNGKGTLRFSGSQFLTSSAQLSAIFPTGNDWTFFIVMVPKGYTNIADFTSYTNGDTYFADMGEYFAVVGTSANGGQIAAANYDGGYFYERRRVAVGTPAVLGVRGSGASSKLSVGGQGRVTMTNSSGAASPTISTLGNTLRIGGQTGGARYGNFEVARIVAYDRALSDAEYDALMAALQSEYGVADLVWAPTTPLLPYWWHSVEPGYVWQDTSATIPAVNLGDTIGRITAKYGSNFLQSTTTRKPYLAALGSRLGARSDNIDDGIGTSAGSGVGPRTVGILWEQFSVPSSTGAETIARMGFNTNQTIIRQSGLSSSAAKGFHFAADRSTATASSIQPAGGPVLLANGIHSLVIRYDGGGSAVLSSYRAWLDGAEISLAIGGNVASSGDSRWLSTSVPSEIFDGTVAESLQWNVALSPDDCAFLAAYLEAFR